MIDDACEALGAWYQGRPVGAQGQNAVFAFYPNKQITTGEGGVVTTHSEETWRLLTSLRNQGRADGGGWLEHARLGFNYRIDDIRAAIGIAQLEKLAAILDARNEAARATGTCSRASAASSCRAPTTSGTHAPGSFVVALPSGTDRERVIGEPDAGGVQTARYLPCIHLQPYMRERYGFAEGLLSRRGGAERAYAGAALPRASPRTTRGTSPTSCGGRPEARCTARLRARLSRSGRSSAADLLAVLVVYALGSGAAHNVSHEGLGGRSRGAHSST